jgi:hypothetical protein
MSFFNIVGIAAALIVLTVILILALFGFGVSSAVWSVASSVNKAANASVQQKIDIRNDHVTIIVPLVTEKGIRIDNIALCNPRQKKDDTFLDPVIQGDGLSSGYACSNGNCTVTFNVENGDLVPAYVHLSVKSADGQCKTKRFRAKNHLTTLGYKATIEFTDTLLKSLDLHQTDFKVGSTHNSGYSSWQLMGTKKTSFSYRKKVPSDSLTIDGRIKADIRFE